MSDDTQRMLGTVIGKLDSLTDLMQNHLEDDRRNFGTIEHRVGKIERKIYWFSGAWAAIGAIITYLVKPHP